MCDMYPDSHASPPVLLDRYLSALSGIRSCMTIDKAKQHVRVRLTSSLSLLRADRMTLAP